MGVPEELIEKLEPYMGLKGQDAADMLKTRPLNLTKEEVDSLDRCVKKNETEGVIRTYNNAVDRIRRHNHSNGTPKHFEELTDQQQSVILSLGYNMGYGFGSQASRMITWNEKKKKPTQGWRNRLRLWNHLVSQDFDAAGDDLVAIADHETGYSKRRMEERRYLLTG